MITDFEDEIYSANPTCSNTFICCSCYYEFRYCRKKYKTAVPNASADEMYKA